MRNPGHLLLRSTLRVVALTGALLAVTAGAASADTGTPQAETASASFGLLGPVGLVAVALGIVGMTLGVLRQRRKARAAEAELTEAVAPAPGESVTKMAEEVLAEADWVEADNTPTRPFLAQQPGS